MYSLSFIYRMNCTYSLYLLDSQRFVRRDDHDVPPGLVHRLEHFGRRGQLSNDVGRAEDGLEIHPRPLAGLPLVQGFLTKHEVVVSFMHKQNKLWKGRAERTIKNKIYMIMSAFEQSIIYTITAARRGLEKVSRFLFKQLSCLYRCFATKTGV